MLIYDTFVNALRYYNGTSWLAVGGDSRGGAFEDAGTVVNQVMTLFSVVRHFQQMVNYNGQAIIF